MGEHPYRRQASRDARRAKVEWAWWAIVLLALWIVSAARALAVLFDRSLAGPIDGPSIALAILIPIIALNARVLAGAERSD